MDIVRIVAIGVSAAIISLVIKQTSPAFSLIVGIAAGLLILIILLPDITSVLNFLQSMTDRINVDIPYAGVLLKVIGIAYLAEFGAQICQDAGESAIASKIEFGGKIMILAISSPIIFALLDKVFSMLNYS